jgi:hypothetical protein
LAETAFLVFYRFKTMSKEEAERAKGEWQNIKINYLLVLSL